MPNITDKITCPYCGAEMLPEENSDDLDDEWNWWYECMDCGSRDPIAQDGCSACKKALRRVE